MGRFFFFLWLHWALRVTIGSVFMASVFAFLISFTIYLSHGAVSISADVSRALVDLFVFWFPLSWSIALLIVLFRSLKTLFNKCIQGYELKLLECGTKEGSQAEVLEVIGYGDLVKVWRKWFMLIIWLVGSMMIFALVFTYFLSSFKSVFEWFNIYWLYTFVLLSGYISFMVLASRCKRVKVVKC